MWYMGRVGANTVVASDDSHSLHHSGFYRIPGNAFKTKLYNTVEGGQWFRALRSTGSRAVIVVKGIDRRKSAVKHSFNILHL